MKLNKYIFTGVSVILAGISLVSCESDFLQKDPTTDITKENFLITRRTWKHTATGFTAILVLLILMSFQIISQYIPEQIIRIIL